MKNELSRRSLLQAGSAIAAGLEIGAKSRGDDKLAVLGGTPVNSGRFPSWPEIRENDERGWMEVLRSKHWFRYEGRLVKKFEETWAKHLGAKYCQATSSGTSALLTCLNALGVGPGDEVLVPPYTFVATVNVVLLQHALPIFVDSDIETFQMNAGKIETAITDRTRCLLPVHLGGSAADMDAILAIGQRRKLPVLEDTCQSHLAEWKGKKLSTLGDLGCFSFQGSKNLNAGEGGAILTNSQELYEKCWAFQNNSGGPAGSSLWQPQVGCNLRMTEFQGCLLLEQMSRVEDQSRHRERNANYLTGMLNEIPGITPAKMYPGCTRNAYHLYMFRYNASQFAGAPKARFLEALRAEGVPCSGGYSPLNKAAFIKNTLDSRAYKTIYSAKQLSEWEERNLCPANDRLCAEAVWLTQNMLLGSKQDMDKIAEAIAKINKNAKSLA